MTKIKLFVMQILKIKRTELTVVILIYLTTSDKAAEHHDIFNFNQIISILNSNKRIAAV